MRMPAVRISRRIRSSIVSSRWRASPRLCLEQQMAAAGEIEAEIDVDRRDPAGKEPVALGLRHHAGHGKQDHDQAGEGDAPHLPAGEVQHLRSGLVVGRLGAVRAHVAQHRLHHPDLDALGDLQLDLMSSTLVTLPIKPPEVIAVSRTFTSATIR